MHTRLYLTNIQNTRIQTLNKATTRYKMWTWEDNHAHKHAYLAVNTFKFFQKPKTVSTHRVGLIAIVHGLQNIKKI